jgi:hypothetical protein
MGIPARDRDILRELARQVAEIAALPVMAERRELWKRHNALQPGHPMILVFPEGAWCELLPDSAIRCEDPDARRMESELRRRIYSHENFHDDTVIEDLWVVPTAIRDSGWGLSPRQHERTAERGSWGFDPVVLEPADLEKLHAPTITVDEEATQRVLEQAEDLFGDILDVRRKGLAHVSFHLMAFYCRLRGLEQVMMDMYENPGMLHEAMRILEEGHRARVAQCVEQNLLSLNNDGTYHSSGGVGYTDELPAPGFDPQHVRPCDIWASAEAQEMAQVSPEMHEEFVLRYERRLLEPFGLNGYGCCEDLTRKLDRVLTIPNIRRISISPWADVDSCAEQIGRRAIFSWKPHPSHLVGSFSPERIRDYIRHTIEAAGDCTLEMILKDTHTCENHPERFTIWTRIARELVDAV